MLLRKRAEEILELVDKTEAELHLPEEAVSGDIYIGGGETHAMGIIAGTISSMQKQHPGIRYHFFSGNAQDVTERLDKGLLDFGILIEPADLGKYESLRLPAKDRWGLMMRKDSPLSEKEHIAPEDVWELPLITSRQRLPGSDLEKWFRRDYDALNIVATYNLVYNASLLVRDGIGYAVCLDKLINTTGDSQLCFRPFQPTLEAGLDIVWKRYQVFTRAAELFLERLHQELPQA